MSYPDQDIIPRVLHFVWVGDENKRPDNCIETWRELHPDFEIRVWGNAERDNLDWRLKRHMVEMAETGQLYGVADLMRWEILERHGGFALDCDSICLRRLPDWLFQCEAFTCWENELESPGLAANGYVACAPGNPLLQYLVARLENSLHLAWRPRKWYQRKRKRFSAWKTTGPLAWTNAIRDLEYTNLTILPSHFFCPRHPSGRIYRGHGPVYCDQLFGSTGESIYETLHQSTPEALRQWVRQQRDESP
ncbi:glycosyltransferase family 32 protein [Alloalcanivorax xenomutans]|jgi:mannosyltransferase OCH1-like enzyme|uniref:glycosyltransferase family 32 protein n=1 Tax=Alloalcanivorax xenomutans TaxID=1094342 RepID=UPI0003B8A976|nr:glycosyltransferase [Alloalcanivorax xenomutans]ERS10176.1 hypothetical protein Q668_20795 [Alcanivorax sp. PN-3]MCE7523212.1 hypothetical protein [Alloalcanivorax xenomutans]WOA32095.1 glycosyltransferase [Alloalcanivorax xenomutans]WOD29059.1 glycosyltransferase [Alloalcanivorax xenomutans]